MPIKTKRWNDPPNPDDGHRLLVTRYRPRGLKKEEETWHAWDKDLAPSIELHAAAYGKNGQTLTLLCSTQCTREDRCHRSLLKSLIERHLA